MERRAGLAHYHFLVERPRPAAPFEPDSSDFVRDLRLHAALAIAAAWPRGWFRGGKDRSDIFEHSSARLFVCDARMGWRRSTPSAPAAFWIFRALESRVLRSPRE